MVMLYAIIHRPTGARYIGSTRQEPEARWAKHRRDLRKGHHHAAPLQRLWQDDGEGAFLFTTLRAVTTPERRWAEQREIDNWLQHHDAATLLNGTTRVTRVG